MCGESWLDTKIFNPLPQLSGLNIQVTRLGIQVTRLDIQVNKAGHPG